MVVSIVGAVGQVPGLVPWGATWRIPKIDRTFYWTTARFRAYYSIPPTV